MALRCFFVKLDGSHQTPPELFRAPARPSTPPADTRRACCHVLSSFQRTGRLFRRFRSRVPPEPDSLAPRNHPLGLFLRNLPILSNHRCIVKHFRALRCNAFGRVQRPDCARTRQPDPVRKAGRRLRSHQLRVTNLSILRNRWRLVNPSSKPPSSV
jgi:hypothetical protein